MKGVLTMAIYKISDLLHSLNKATNDGFEYVELSEVPPEDDEPACLFASYIIEACAAEEDIIDSSELPENYFYPAKDL